MGIFIFCLSKKKKGGFWIFLFSLKIFFKLFLNIGDDIFKIFFNSIFK